MPIGSQRLICTASSSHKRYLWNTGLMFLGGVAWSPPYKSDAIRKPSCYTTTDSTVLPVTQMRLINIHTLRFKNFTHEPPPYAIASHRWCADETTHQDVRDVRNVNSSGFRKVKNFGKAILSVNETVQSSAAWAAMGFQLKCDWLWIDTACINKRDLSELSESINSMFRWYRSAAVCYAYPADVGPMSFHYGAMMDFMRSEWFERGWTLQELLAPGVVVFLAKDWSVIGHKCPYDKPLCDMVCRWLDSAWIPSSHVLRRSL
jgi:hypothetical protein